MPCPTSPAGGKVSANGVFSRGPQTTGRVGETANACELGGLLEKSYHESRLLLIIYCWLAFLLLRECFHTPSHFIPTYMRGFPRLNTWASAAQEDADTDSDPPAACLCQGPVLGGVHVLSYLLLTTTMHKSFYYSSCTESLGPGPSFLD